MRITTFKLFDIEEEEMIIGYLFRYLEGILVHTDNIHKREN